MYATYNGKNVPLNEISLDDFAWDEQSIQDSQILTLHLTESDLMKIGTTLFASSQEALDEDPEYFQGEYMNDVPVPESERVFLEKPLLVATYLENAFWSRQTIIAILDAMKPSLSFNVEGVSYWIHDFRQAMKEGNDLAAEFGVWIKQ